METSNNKLSIKKKQSKNEEIWFQICDEVLKGISSLSKLNTINFYGRSFIIFRVSSGDCIFITVDGVSCLLDRFFCLVRGSSFRMNFEKILYEICNVRDLTEFDDSFETDLPVILFSEIKENFIDEFMQKCDEQSGEVIFGDGMEIESDSGSKLNTEAYLGSKANTENSVRVNHSHNENMMPKEVGGYRQNMNEAISVPFDSTSECLLLNENPISLQSASEVESELTAGHQRQVELGTDRQFFESTQGIETKSGHQPFEQSIAIDLREEISTSDMNDKNRLYKSDIPTNKTFDDHFINSNLSKQICSFEKSKESEKKKVTIDFNTPTESEKKKVTIDFNTQINKNFKEDCENIMFSTKINKNFEEDCENTIFSTKINKNFEEDPENIMFSKVFISENDKNDFLFMPQPQSDQFFKPINSQKIKNQKSKHWQENNSIDETNFINYEINKENNNLFNFNENLENKNYLKDNRSEIKREFMGNVSSNRPFICHFKNCNRAFKRFEHLKRHYRIHTGERPFKCKFPGCQKSFARSDNLNQHLKVHNNNCNFITDQRSNRYRYSGKDDR